jgi:hypothetical protein
MSKSAKSEKTKITVSFRIDPDIQEQATQKLLRESVLRKERITFSAKVEELIKEWLKRKD